MIPMHEEEQLFQARILSEIHRCMAIRRMSADEVATALGVTADAWQRLATGLEPITAYQLYQCAGVLNTSFLSLIPDARVVRTDLLMSMALSLPPVMFDELFKKTVHLATGISVEGDLSDE